MVARSKNTLQTVERALTVLETIAQTPEDLNRRDLAEIMGLNISTTYHLVNTLIVRGYLVDDEVGILRLGPSSANLYRSIFDSDAHSDPIQSEIQRFADRCNETVYLTISFGARVVIRQLVESTKNLKVSGLDVGYSGSEHLRASGKAVLAHLDKDILFSYIAQLDGELSNSDRDALLAELDEIRSSGVASDREDYEQGICCVAAPYRRADGVVAGSVAVSVPAVRFTELEGNLTKGVLDVASQISSVLGARDGAEK